jgi:hypothetical protein
MEIHEVASLEEAVALAESLKADGSYDLFRGQARDYPPLPSLARILASGDSAKAERARRRLRLFEQWLASIPELAYLLDVGREHDFFAVAQHYGIPTNYLDFTSEPSIAGFFAADTREPPTDRRSCIYLLNSEELRDVWDTLKDVDERAGAILELVTIDVTNLWRLQAQRGVFVATNYNWEIDFPLDRIVFPYSGYLAAPTAEEIYPTDKSPLEQLLDQHFSLEAATYANEEIRAMIEDLQKKGSSASWDMWKAFRGGVYAPAFLAPDDLKALPSWNADDVRPWWDYVDEDYHATVGEHADVHVEATEPAAIGQEIREDVAKVLQANGGLRQRAVSWTFTGLPAAVDGNTLDEMFRVIWNGMRRLPYSDDQLAIALGHLTRLLVGERTSKPGGRDHERFPALFDDGMQVELGYADGSGSRAYVSKRRLGAAMRADLRSLLVPEHQKLVDDPRDVFRVLYNPQLLFDFGLLQSLFAEAVIPTQVVMRRTPVLFNPARLVRLGLP